MRRRRRRWHRRRSGLRFIGHVGARSYGRNAGGLPWDSLQDRRGGRAVGSAGPRADGSTEVGQTAAQDAVCPTPSWVGGAESSCAMSDNAARFRHQGSGPFADTNSTLAPKPRRGEVAQSRYARSDRRRGRDTVARMTAIAPDAGPGDARRPRSPAAGTARRTSRRLRGDVERAMHAQTRWIIGAAGAIAAITVAILRLT